ncbi:hypothetical protein PR202_ga04055 [Eleusine coracana subsp. coracana]|uniref:Uncharacterized protein n=1 Tax=Eleusine coracana subsp. coracana TaxID=191504 RepID=A0AAV5BQ51_ELECO|nr:hypothetical protein PR202_ga04055 [Eleusine coracana subsp. coracana]
MDQFPVASQESSVTVGSAESSTAPIARAPNGVTASAPAPAAVAGGLLGDDDDVPEPAACISSMIDRGGSVESHRLFLARRTVLEMLRDRGYSVLESDLARTLPEFRAWWADRPELERLSIATTLASDHSSKGKIMSQARESIKDIFPFKIDIFQITELLVNITKHVLKPKHEVLTEEEKSKLLKEYNVKDSQLPRMLETDAVSRYCGLGKSTVVKVIYDSELTGNHVTYRCIF